jgi:glutamate-1-semialdehyde 2,1-aminomutase
LTAILDLRRSRAYRESARRHLAFGVSSTPRAAQRPAPIVAERAEGAWITDADGNRYIDYALGYGPLILGHSPPTVMAAIRAELDRGLRTASVHRGEAALAELIAACVPSAEQTAFVNTGTEAVQLALRIARAATGRLPVVKFRANYHGWFDNVHVANRPGQDGPGTLGQDPHAADALTILDWGDADALERGLDDRYAAVLLEPAAINPGCFAPPDGFLRRVRDAASRHGALLIYDEVITGFRLGLGCAQARYGVLPDLTVLGKALGGGLPIGAVSGTSEAMRPVATGALFQRGTFNGHPLSMAAGAACVQVLRAGEADIYPRMERFAVALANHVNAEAMRFGVAVCAQQVGPALQLFAGLRHLCGLNDLASVDRDGVLALTGALLCRGVQAIPRGLLYLSAAHGEAEIEATMRAITGALRHYGDTHDANDTP